jgi:hypothetical protein|tara:strand:+ start:438 stop:824 length:387 start_codon:yes stop_codon:yes gene_type:complete
MTKTNDKVATSPNTNDKVLQAILNVPTPTNSGKASTYALNDDVATLLATKPLPRQAKVIVNTIAKLGGKVTKAELVAELKANNKGGDDNYDLKANQPVDKVLTHYNQRLGGYGKDYGGVNATKYLLIK